MLKIKEMPVLERPYEKLERYGCSQLSNAELLAIIIKTGTREETSVEIAKKLLNKKEGEKTFYFLQTMSIEEMVGIKGIGRVKAIQLKALFELAKRINEEESEPRICLRTLDNVYNFVAPDIKYEVQENLVVVTCDINNCLIRKEVICKGDLSEMRPQMRNIFKTAISNGGSGIFILHNHPSGDSTPTQSDIDFTKKIISVGDGLDVDVLDHIIIGKNDYMSFRVNNLI